MSATSVVAGLMLLAAGIFGLRFGWRKHDQASDRIIEDIRRINVEKPGADLDSDPAFVEHRANATGWLTLLAMSLALVVIGGVITLANLS